MPNAVKAKENEERQKDTMCNDEMGHWRYFEKEIS